MKTLPTVKEIIAAHRIFQQVKRYEMAFVGQPGHEAWGSDEETMFCSW